jgi:hypothetical protein
MRLVRAFYDKFDRMKDGKSINVRTNIARCVWKTNKLDAPEMDAPKIAFLGCLVCREGFVPQRFEGWFDDPLPEKYLRCEPRILSTQDR